jgi:hypothetical protein
MGLSTQSDLSGYIPNERVGQSLVLIVGLPKELINEKRLKVSNSVGPVKRISSLCSVLLWLSARPDPIDLYK